VSSVLSTVVFNHKSGLVEDQVINAFAFDTLAAAPSGGTLDDITTALQSFYNDDTGGMDNSLATYLAPCISRAELPVVKHYVLDGNLDGSAHGSPVRIDEFTSLDATGAATGLPAEVACCLSFHGSFGTDPEFGPGTRPRSRDRGRIYFGPLITGVSITDGTTGRVVPAGTFIADLIIAGQRLRDDADTHWSVWSRADAALKLVTQVSVDDAWDTQRRRGETATQRFTG